MDKTEKQIVKIKNNNHCVEFHTYQDIIKFIYMQIQAYKKFIYLLDDFVELLTKLQTKTFSNINNIEHVIQVIKNAMYTLYNNIIMLFTVRYNNIQLVNISLTSCNIHGFKIFNTITECDVNNNLHHYINSMRIQHYDKGLIKIVYNNNSDLPNNIFFIGIHRDECNNDEQLNDLINKCKETVLVSASKIKIIQLNYIQLYNNLQNMLNKG